MKKLSKTATFVLVICLGAVSFTGCGDKTSGKKTDKNDIESSFDSMDEKELESKIKEAAEKLDKEDKKAESNASGYAPTDEIKNADLSSGLIQIRNDVFKRGGYYTVNQFIEEFGDRYDMRKIDPDETINALSTCSADIYVNDLMEPFIHIRYAPLTEEYGSKVGDAVVIDFDVMDWDTEVNDMWYPTGITYENDARYKGLKWADRDSFGESFGLTKTFEPEKNKKYDAYEGGVLIVNGTEKNLFGVYPVFVYHLYFDEDTECADYFCSTPPRDCYYQNTDDWTSAKES